MFHSHSQLLEHVYPALLTAEQTPQQVEILVPLGPERAEEEEEEEEKEGPDREAGGVDAPLLPASPPDGPMSTPRRASYPHSQLNSSLKHRSTRQRKSSIRSSQSVTETITVGSPAASSTSDHSSWEVLSRHSTTSNRLSVIPDMSSRRSVVPLWECIQEAFKTPVIHVSGSKLLLPRVIPDLLFADLPPELIFWSKVGEREEEMVSNGQLMLPPSKELSGLFVHRYYTSKQEDMCVRQPAGALKAVSETI